MVGDMFEKDNPVEFYKKLNKYRKSLGMRLIKQGERDCLNCEALFYSQDLAKIKMCTVCRRIKNHESRSE